MKYDAPSPNLLDSTQYDVVILGGALSGSACAVQLLTRNRSLRVLILEMSESLGRRVGESTVEISSYFLGRVLGLTAYLNDQHLVKQGLRFWFANEHSHCFESCSEIGPKYTTSLASYQVDRLHLDEEVLRRARDLGATVLRPATATSACLESSGLQTITFTQDGAEHRVTARWLVDATGVHRFLARKNGWCQANNEHPIASIWSRWQGVQCWDDTALHAEFPHYGQRCFGVRQTATNHLVGRGWWSWWIPLKGGDTSVGIVYDQRIVDLPDGADPIDRMRKLLNAHPLAEKLLHTARHDPGDVHFRKNLSYTSTTMVGDGFALVGDAAAFIDPFYSPGMDWISFSTASVCSLILKERAGQMTPSAAGCLDADLRLSYRRWFEAIYKDKYYYMGDFDLMKLAFQLDLGLYYLGVVSQPFKRGWEGLTQPPFTGPGTDIPFLLIRHYNRRLAKIAKMRMTRRTWGRHNSYRYLPFQSYRFNSALPARVFGQLVKGLFVEATEGWMSWLTSPDTMPSGLPIKQAPIVSQYNLQK